MADDWVSVRHNAAQGDDWTPVNGAAAPTQTVNVTAHRPPDQPAGRLPQMTPAERVGTGMVDPIQGGAQLLSHVVPGASAIDRLNNWMADTTGLVAKLPPGGMDEQTQQREATIQAETPNPDKVVTTLDQQGRASHANVSKQPGTDPYRMLGNVISPVTLSAPTKALGEANLLRRVGSAAVQGATIGATEPVTGKGSFSGQKATQVVEGALGGALTPPAEGAARALTNWVRSTKGDEALNDKAVQAILKRIQTSQKGGGPTTQDMLDLVNTAPSKPWVLADMPAANLKALVGKVARSPGEAKQIMQSALTGRDLDASLRMRGDITEPLGDGSAAYTEEALRHARSIMAKPLFDKAYEGGSLAPLKDQFDRALNEATIAEQEAAHDLQYAESTQHYGDRKSQALVEQARQKWQTANATKRMVMDKLHEVQDDIATGKSGAVWSPRVQAFLDNPRVKIGLQRGLRIERDEALAAGRPMNPSEYAITGADEEGNPIIGKVPTMRLLATAKEGLDAMVYGDEYRNKLTGQLNKEGVTIDKIRRQFVDTLDGLNPDYKAARDVWAGESDSMEALKSGQDIFKMEPEAIEAMVHGSSPEKIRAALTGRVPDDVIDEAVSRAGKGLTPGEKEFFKLGAAIKMRRMMEDTGEKGDESRKLIGSTTTRRQLRALFDSDEEFDKFFKSLNAEHMMFDTWAKTYGGSQTAERVADDAAPNVMGMAHGALGLWETLKGSPYGPYQIGMAWEKLKPKENPAQTAAQAKLLTSPAAGAIERLRAAEAATAKPGPRVAPWLVPGAVYGTEPRYPVPAQGATQGMP